jgi:hypothetical protein
VFGQQAPGHFVGAAVHMERALHVVFWTASVHVILKLPKANLRLTVGAQHWTPWAAAFMRLAKPCSGLAITAVVTA